MSKILRAIQRGARTVQIAILECGDGWRRITDPINLNVLNEHIKRVSEEKEQLPSDTEKAIIRSMFHKSEEDPTEHITLDCYDKDGKHKKTIHVAKDKREQQSYR